MVYFFEKIFRPGAISLKMNGNGAVSTPGYRESHPEGWLGKIIYLVQMNSTAIKARATRRLKICAMVCLGLLTLFTIGLFLDSYQVRRQRVSPLVPDSLVSQMSEQYLLHAVVSCIMLAIAVGIYLLKRYWWAILLVAFTLVGNRYLNW